MKRSNRLVILVGVLLAVLAFVGIVVLLNQGGGVGGPTEEVVVTETVLVATEAIEIGEEVTPDKVEAQEVDPEAVSGTPLRDPSQVGGRPSLFNVPAGTQVSQETIGLNLVGQEDISGQLQLGEKAIAVRLDPQTGVNFLVQPGDTVDIVISSEISVIQPTADSAAAGEDAPTRFEDSGLEGRSVKTVLQSKRVLYVSGTRISAPPTTTPEGEEEAPAAQPETFESIILVFAGTDQDAEIVKFVQRDNSELSSERTDIPTSITVVIRASDDEAVEETTGITLDILVEQHGLLLPGIVEELSEEVPAP